MLMLLEEMARIKFLVFKVISDKSFYSLIFITLLTFLFSCVSVSLQLNLGPNTLDQRST